MTIINEIDAAIASHGLWKLRLLQAIEEATSEFEVEFVRSCHHCDFGKWLDSQRIALSKSAFYEEVYELHKQVHITTADIMELAIGKNKYKARELLEGDFAKVSNALVHKLIDWKKANCRIL